MAKGQTSIPADKLEAYDRLIAARPHLERKGATMPYTSVNGHMFSFLSPDGSMGLRLPPQERVDFAAKYTTTLALTQGVVMREYVSVPESLLAKTDELLPYLDVSYLYVAGLKPKGSKSAARE